MTLREAINKFSTIARSAPTIMRQAHKEAFAKLESALPQVAANALLPNVDEADRLMAERFLKTFQAHNQDPKMRFTLSRPTFSAKGDGIEGVTAEDIERWVRAGANNKSEDNRFGKVLDELVDRDIEEVIRKMQGILVFADPRKLRPDQSQMEAQRNYLPAVVEFMNSSGIDPQKLAHWCQIILVAWVAYVRGEWPQILVKHLRAAFR